MISGAFAESPLRWLMPKSHGAAAWIVSTTFGGGLVDGDAIDVDVDVEARAELVVLTQASTKVYPGASRQRLRASVAPGGLLALLPDPVACFAGARYAQTTEIDLAPDASLLVVDGFTAGRPAHDVSWAFDLFASEIVVRRGGALFARDATRLDAEDGDVAARMGSCRAFCTALAVGPRAGDACRAMIARAGAPQRDATARSASRIGDDAVLFRVAAPSMEIAQLELRSALGNLDETLGDDPLARKR